MDHINEIQVSGWMGSTMTMSVEGDSIASSCSEMECSKSYCCIWNVFWMLGTKIGVTNEFNMKKKKLRKEILAISVIVNN